MPNKLIQMLRIENVCHAKFLDLVQDRFKYGFKIGKYE